jgi:hypothetical protein
MKSLKMAKGESHEPPKQFHHLEVRPAKPDELEHGQEGGHVITHHFDNSAPGTFHDPETHGFGAGQGKEAMEHIASAANIDAAAGDAKPEHSAELEAQNEEEGEEKNG